MNKVDALGHLRVRMENEKFTALSGAWNEMLPELATQYLSEEELEAICDDEAALSEALSIVESAFLRHVTRHNKLISDLSDEEAYEIISRVEYLLETLALRRNKSQWMGVRGSLERVQKLAQHCLDAERLHL